MRIISNVIEIIQFSGFPLSFKKTQVALTNRVCNRRAVELMVFDSNRTELVTFKMPKSLFWLYLFLFSDSTLSPFSSSHTQKPDPILYIRFPVAACYSGWIVPVFGIAVFSFFPPLICLFEFFQILLPQKNDGDNEGHPLKLIFFCISNAKRIGTISAPSRRCNFSVREAGK